jgi:hypothetical protein
MATKRVRPKAQVATARKTSARRAKADLKSGLSSTQFSAFLE